MDTPKEKEIDKAIRKHFRFLLDLGYQLGPIEQTGNMSNWNAELASEELMLRIVSDRGELFLIISPAAEECWIGLDVAIYFATGKKVLPAAFEGDLFKDQEKQLGRLSELLRMYFSDIRQIFTDRFATDRDRLLSLRREVDAMQLKRFSQRR